MVESLYGIEDEKKSIWVLLENDGQQLERVSLELINKSREIANQLGWQVGGLLMGNHIDHVATQAIHHGVDQVWIADHPLLELFRIEIHSLVAYEAVIKGKPSVFLCGATPNGRDLAGRLAVRLRTGLNADCTNLYMNIDTVVLVSEVSGFGGGVLALIEMADHRPQMATVRPGVFQAAIKDENRRGEIIPIKIPISDELICTHLVDQKAGQTIDLTQAKNLVIGGRGVGGNFASLKKIAALIGGEVGTTRPPVDDGHIEKERMIGQTGVTCRPKTALCLGISGSFHFIVGIQEAETVIAINTDPDAPIFDHADYCIVGDVNEYIPALVRELKRQISSSQS
jgi:electron transfer flavoprotein alpha subunit